ncbi:MAG TPA: YdeI family protein [Opitutales bacterium]|nr:YdeI family protein [Opitutales bacterium]
MNPKVDAYIGRAKNWVGEFTRLRALILDCGLTEELKWGHPCYTHDGANVVLMHGFKEYCALLFFKGVLLKDPQGILIRQTEHVQVPRQVRFASVAEMVKLEKTLKAYIREAIAVEKAGLTVKLKTTADFKIPEEFQARLDRNPALKKAFAALTPGRQRGYLFYFSQAKQSETRAARVEKHTRRILAGKGLDD